jgi:hypothetical protein
MKLWNDVLIPEELKQASDHVFQNTREGDGKMQFHYSTFRKYRQTKRLSPPEYSLPWFPCGDHGRLSPEAK